MTPVSSTLVSLTLNPLYVSNSDFTSGHLITLIGFLGMFEPFPSSLTFFCVSTSGPTPTRRIETRDPSETPSLTRIVTRPGRRTRTRHTFGTSTTGSRTRGLCCVVPYYCCNVRHRHAKTTTEGVLS